MIPYLLRKGWIIDKDWMNMAIKEYLKNPTNENTLKQIIQYSTTKIVETDNLLNLLDLSEELQANLDDEESTNFHKNQKRKLESNFIRRKLQLKHHLSQFKSAEDRQTLDDDMSLYLD